MPRSVGRPHPAAISQLARMPAEITTMSHSSVLPSADCLIMQGPSNAV
jgi:hypothetical protein